MKLVLVTHFFPSRGGGIEAVAEQLARHLLDERPDLDIEWFASKGERLPAPSARLRFVPVRAWHGIETKLGVPCPVWRARDLARLWRSIGRADAVHLHDFSYHGNACAALFCVSRRKPFLVTQHIGPVPMKTRALEHALETLNSTLGVWILNRAAARVFVSDVVRRYFQERGAKPGLVVPNGVDDAVFSPVAPSERAQLRERAGLAPDARVALFAGRFVLKKGVSLVLELARRTPEIEWILAGRGPLDPGDAPLPNVRVVRDRTAKGIADLFRVADILVLPSRGEGFPLVVQEALACGTPVLVESAIGEAAPDARQWMNFETLDKTRDDIERWSLKLRAILDEMNASSNLPEQRAARAQWARREWNWKTCARSYLELLQAALDKPAH
jgi:glycosyltransferase involved in cell wall biosynthesis